MYTLSSTILAARDAATTSTSSATTTTPPISHTMIILLIVLLVLLILALLLVATLLFMRQRRRRRQSHNILPVYDEKRFSTSSTSSSSHRRVLTRPAESVYVYNEKQELIKNSDSPPPSPLPEIRITFPEEVDESGKRQSGRVVVVRIGENGIGLEPVEGGVTEYEQAEGGRLYSIDLDRVGGLVEKARNSPPRKIVV